MEAFSANSIFAISLCMTGLCWLLVLTDFLTRRKAVVSESLMKDAFLALVALTIVLLSYLPIVSLENWVMTTAIFSMGAIAVLAYIRLQPSEFSLWKTPAKRIITVSTILVISGIYTALSPSPAFIPMLFASIIVTLYARSLRLTLTQCLGELAGLNHKILTCNATIQNHAVFQKAKTEDDFLGKTG